VRRAARGRHQGEDHYEAQDQESKRQQVTLQQEAHSQSLLGTSSTVWPGGLRLDAYRKGVVKRHHMRPMPRWHATCTLLTEARSQHPRVRASPGEQGAGGQLQGGT